MSYFLAVDVGKTNIGIVLGDEEGFCERVESYSSGEYWSQEGLETVISSYLSSKDIEVSDVERIGMAVPGVVNRQEKCVEKDIMDSRIDFSELEESLGIEISIANDGDVAVLGQKQVHGSENLVNIIIGSGIGAGVVYDGKLLWGDQRGGPEPGSTFVGEEIWQAYGGNIIPEKVNEWLEDEERNTELGDEIETASELFQLSSDDEVAQGYLEEIEQAMARGITNTVNAYAPDFLTFTGSVATKNPEFIRRCFERASEDFFNQKPEIKISDPDAQIPLKGALALARKDR
ncbi:MAG: ROK family protein [Candidatus Nanosalina sp.]